MKFSFSALFILFFTTVLFPQEARNWQQHSAQQSVSSGILTAEGLWGGATGGIFYYDFATGEYTTYAKPQGMSGSPVTCMTIDSEGKIWAGTVSGSIDVLDPETGLIKRIMDIANSDATLKSIRSLAASGDTVFAGSDLALSMINTETYDFYDSILKFGDFPPQTPVNASELHGVLIVSTGQGVAVQKQGAQNLNAPESWDTYSEQDGLNASTVLKAGYFGTTLIAATTNGISWFDGASWDTWISDLNGLVVKDFLSVGGSLYIMTSRSGTNTRAARVFRYADGALQEIIPDLNTANRFVGIEGGVIYMASEAGIIAWHEDGSREYLLPEGPLGNLFNDMSVSPDKTLWVASGNTPSGIGFYSLSSGEWTNYYMANTPEIHTDFFHRVFAAPDGRTFVASWGNGFIEISPEGEITEYSVENTEMEGITTDPNYLVIADIAYDTGNNLWVLNYEAADRKNLVMRTTDGTWHFFENRAARSVSIYSDLVVDVYDTKWFVSAERRGVYYFNEMGTPTNPDDDVYGFVNESYGLNGEVINDIVLDRRGQIWLATNLGVNIIGNPGAVVTEGQGPSYLQTNFSFPLRQLTITALAVDPINRKWIGTNQGLLLVSADGTKLLEAYDTRNSPLLADNIKSLAIDDQSGTVYAGMEGGIIAFDTDAAAPMATYAELFAYPSPYVLDGSGQMLTIDGLVKDSEINILSVSGKLVRNLKTPGGRMGTWDGRDDNGSYVSSGVYIIVAADENGEQISTAKIAVIRK